MTDTQSVLTSSDIKLAVMRYYRWQRNMLCATEVLYQDVSVFKGDHIFEIEVKVSKSDLWNGERKKSKHAYEYANPTPRLEDDTWRCFIPNKFFIAVPPKLADEAVRFCKETNRKYGVIIAHKNVSGYLWCEIKQRAGYLHKDRLKDWIKRAFFMRVCAENIYLRGGGFH